MSEFNKEGKSHFLHWLSKFQKYKTKNEKLYHPNNNSVHNYDYVRVETIDNLRGILWANQCCIVGVVMRAKFQCSVLQQFLDQNDAVLRTKAFVLGNSFETGAQLSVTTAFLKWKMRWSVGLLKGIKS